MTKIECRFRALYRDCRVGFACRSDSRAPRSGTAPTGQSIGAARGGRECLEIDDLKSQISNLKSLAESCSRQIRGWADSLQNSDIAGQRKLNDKSLAACESKRRAESFLKQVDEVVRRQHAPQSVE